jgi:hypothetical protein
MVATAPTNTFMINVPAGGEDSFWLTKQRDGNVTEEKVERNIYTVPPMGTYRLRLLRFAKPFQLPKAPEYLKPGDDPMQTMTRLELMIVGGPGHGRMCTPMVTVSLGERSKLGQIARAAIKRDLASSEAFDLLSICHNLDQENDAHDFMATLKPSIALDEMDKPKYTNIVDKTISKVSETTDDGWPG